MSKFNYDDYSEEAVNEMVEKGGRAKETIGREANVLQSFTNFVNNEKDVESLEALWSNKSLLDSILTKYFYCFRLKNGEMPKRNTVEQFKSFLKIIILKNTDSKWDISKQVDFPKFKAFYKG